MDKLDTLYDTIAELRDKVFVNEEDVWFDGFDVTGAIVGSHEEVLHYTMKLLERLQKERDEKYLTRMKSKYELNDGVNINNAKVNY